MQAALAAAACRLRLRSVCVVCIVVAACGGLGRGAVWDGLAAAPGVRDREPKRWRRGGGWTWSERGESDATPVREPRCAAAEPNGGCRVCDMCVYIICPPGDDAAPACGERTPARRVASAGRRRGRGRTGSLRTPVSALRAAARDDESHERQPRRHCVRQTAFSWQKNMV